MHAFKILQCEDAQVCICNCCRHCTIEACALRRLEGSIGCNSLHTVCGAAAKQSSGCLRSSNKMASELTWNRFQQLCSSHRIKGKAVSSGWGIYKGTRRQPGFDQEIFFRSLVACHASGLPLNDLQFAADDGVTPADEPPDVQRSVAGEANENRCDDYPFVIVLSVLRARRGQLGVVGGSRRELAQ